MIGIIRNRRQGLLAMGRVSRTAHISLSRGTVSALQDAVSWNCSSSSSSSSSSDAFHGYQQPYTLIGKRFFAAAPSPKDPADDEKDVGVISKTFRQVITPQNQFYALLAGGTMGAYAISRIFLAFTGFFTHLTPTVAAKWGFYSGFSCATMVGGLALITAENMFIRADPVYKYCLDWVQNDTYIQQQLGDGIQPGSLRSYRLDSGQVEIVGHKAVWRPPRIQMIFDIKATGPPYRTGIVTCEAIKSVGIPPSLTTTFLKVDYETGNEGEEGGTREGDETYFLKGSQEDLTRVSRRSGLSLDMLARAVHIEKAAAGRHH